MVGFAAGYLILHYYYYYYYFNFITFFFSRERIELSDKIAKLQATVSESREKEQEATTKLKRMQEALEQANFDRSQVS